MAVEIATAYFSLLPSMAGTAAAVQSGLGSPAVVAAARRGGIAQGAALGAGLSSELTPLLKRLGLIAIATGVVDYISSAIDKASDLNESANAVKVTFGEAADEVARLGETASTRLGLSRSDFNSLAVRFSAFSKVVAGDGRAVSAVLDELTTRAADFASVMNLDVADASTLFQSGLAGESEPLRRYGIDVSAATVQQTAWRLGIAETGRELTEQQKIQARYAAIMEQTNQVSGDFANTSNELANSQRINQARFDDLAASLGSSLLPASKEFQQFLGDDLLPLLERGAKILEEWAPAIADATDAYLAFSTPAQLNTLFDIIDALEDGKYTVEEFGDVLAGMPTRMGDAYIGFVNFLSGLMQSSIGFFNGVLDAALGPVNAIRSLYGLGPLNIRINAPNISISRAPTAGVSTINGLTRTRRAGLASGGVLDTEGVVRVGEHGPENLYLPQNAEVHPLGIDGGSSDIRPLLVRLIEVTERGHLLYADGMAIAQSADAGGARLTSLGAK